MKSHSKSDTGETKKKGNFQEKCGNFFNSSKELKIHIDTDHKQNVVRSFLQTKLRILEIDLSKQRKKLTSSLLKLRERNPG